MWSRGRGRSDVERRHKMTSGEASRSYGVTRGGVWVPVEIALIWEN